VSSPEERMLDAPALGYVKVDEMGVWVPASWGKLVVGIRFEIDDPEWLNHPHGLQKVYVRGCRGPLCRWAQRNYIRDWTRNGIEARGGRVSQYTSHLDKYNDFIQMYAEAFWSVIPPDAVPVKRPRKQRTVRTPHTVPASTVQKLHKSRARLAS
jgi:hypothetical protein